MQLELLETPSATPPATPAIPPTRPAALPDDLRAFKEFGTDTREILTRAVSFAGNSLEVPTFVNEYWTARQRQGNSLHEISYRACFKSQLPRFFIERLSQPGDRVYDPFMGRGTTPLEAALLGRVPIGNDINPLSTVLVQPRLCPPTLDAIAERLKTIPLDKPADEPEDLLAFYHPEVLKAISSLKRYFIEREDAHELDGVDGWLRMVTLNRLTGHSAGFLSVYTLPPNQATSPQAQRKINEKRNQTPPTRTVPAILLKKSRQLLKECTPDVRRTLEGVPKSALLLTCPAEATPAIASNSVKLVVTSPPFLDIVQYSTDNWLRCWFLGLDAREVRITMLRKLEDWQAAMSAVFRELDRVLEPGGHIAFEVGEVRSGTIKLEEAVLPCGVEAGLEPVLIVINDQEFTKTANCWGVDNMSKGTNTNRIVVFRKAVANG